MQALQSRYWQHKLHTGQRMRSYELVSASQNRLAKAADVAEPGPWAGFAAPQGAHPSRMSVEAMMTKALAVSLKPPNMRPTVRNSCPRPSLCRVRMPKPSRPVVLSATTFSRHCAENTVGSANVGTR